MLEAEFKREKIWSKKFITALAKRLNLSISKLYKWHWDRKKKTGDKKMFQLARVVNKNIDGYTNAIDLEPVISEPDSSEKSIASQELDNTSVFENKMHNAI